MNWPVSRIYFFSGLGIALSVWAVLDGIPYLSHCVAVASIYTIIYKTMQGKLI